jgi:tetratricopeptide (TPR) repeat protein
MAKMRNTVLLAGALVFTLALCQPVTAADEETEVTESSAAVETTQAAAPVLEYVKLLGQAKDALAKGEGSKAVSLLESARSLAPGNSDIARTLFDAYGVAKEDDKLNPLLVEMIADNSDLRNWAIPVYYNRMRSAEGIDAGIKALEKAAAGKPNSIGLNIGIAEGYVIMQNWNKVADVYTALVKVYPNDAVLNIRMMDAYGLAHRYDDIIKVMEPRVSADPNNISNSDTLINAYIKSGMTKEAANLLKARIAKNPNAPDLHGRYAQALMDAGDFDASAAEWSTAFDCDKTNFFFKQQAAQAYLAGGKYGEAKKQLQELLKVVSETKPGMKAVVESQIADIDKAARKK